MSATRTERRSQRTTQRSGSAHLGGNLRRVLIAPRDGFRSGLRSNVIESAAGSPLPALMVFLGGAGTMILWLKVTSLTQLTDERPADETTLGTVLLAVLVGAVFGIGAYFAWGRLAPMVAMRSGGDGSSERLRLVWAFADFPLAAYVAIFLPLDLLVVGPEMFSQDRLQGSFEMVWAAFSVALGLSAAAWTTYLLWRGIESATGLRGRSVFLMLLMAFGLGAVLYVSLVVKELFT